MKQKGNNCRYNAFITIFCFTISSYLINKKDSTLKDLNEFNNLVLKLANEVNEKNYIDLIIFLQKNKYDVNNALIDKIINEEDDEKKALLIAQMNNDNSIDFNSSGYVAQLFSLFKNNELFCIIESKNTECILCGKKITENVKDSPPFIFIKKDYLNEKHIYNILLNRYKEIYSYDCECRKVKTYKIAQNQF